MSYGWTASTISLLARSDDFAWIKLVPVVVIALIWIVAGVASVLKKASALAVPKVATPPQVPGFGAKQTRKVQARNPQPKLVQPKRKVKKQVSAKPPKDPRKVIQTRPLSQASAPMVASRSSGISAISSGPSRLPGQPSSTATGGLNAAAVRRVLNPAVLRSQIALAEVFERPESVQ